MNIFAARDFARRGIPLAIWIALVGFECWVSGVVDAPPPLAGYARMDVVDIAAMATGRIDAVMVGLGDRVDAGEVVARLDDSDIVAEIGILRAQRAEVFAEVRSAQAAAARSELDLLNEFARAADNIQTELSTARTQLATAEAEREVLEGQYKVQQTVVERGLAPAISLNELEVRLATLRQREASGRQLVDVLHSSQRAVNERRAALASEAPPAPVLRERLDVIDRRLDNLEQKRRAMVLTAPISGVVEELSLRPGAVARAGASILRIVDTSSQQLIICIPEPARNLRRAATVKVGQQASIALGQVHVAGEIQALSPRVMVLPARCQTSTRDLWGRTAVVKLHEPADLVGEKWYAVHLAAADHVPGDSPGLANAGLR